MPCRQQESHSDSGRAIQTAGEPTRPPVRRVGCAAMHAGAHAAWQADPARMLGTLGCPLPACARVSGTPPSAGRCSLPHGPAAPLRQDEHAAAGCVECKCGMAPKFSVHALLVKEACGACKSVRMPQPPSPPVSCASPSVSAMSGSHRSSSLCRGGRSSAEKSSDQNAWAGSGTPAAVPAGAAGNRAAS